MTDISLPAQSEVKIDIHLTARLNVTDFTAQRRVSKLLLDQVGNLLYGERPTLLVGRRLLWRVPVWFGRPPDGPIGQVGHLDVDAQTGEILYSQLDLNLFAERGNALARRSASAAS
ncbi:MAG: hypothetical protein RMK99_07115 [Anaerolineales bacterium]|nr:hypothetical protein [Anaerolineales bacterium]